MSKYSVGDKFVIEIEMVNERKSPFDNMYGIKGGCGFSEIFFDRLQKVDSNMKIKDITDMIAEYDTEKKGYNKGLQDAWELAGRCISFNSDGRLKIFGTDNPYCILREQTYEEALAKLEAYEKEQAEIKVGDVVYANDEPCCYGVVTWVNKNMGLIYIMWGDGSCGNECKLSEIHKTGKHINIESLLGQIYE